MALNAQVQKPRRSRPPARKGGAPSRRRAAAARPTPLDGEEVHQRALVTWAGLYRRVHPELRMLFAVPNGGERSARAGAGLKRQGVRRGVPDLCLPVARGCWFGLWIELKRPGPHNVSPEQRWWIDHLTRAGYRAEVAVGWEAARQLLLDYLALPPTPRLADVTRGSAAPVSPDSP